MAYGNNRLEIFGDHGDVLVVFQGPHAYISSFRYRKEEVPIWNYQAIHVQGIASILEIDELIEELAMMLKKYEENRENIVLWDELSPQLLEREVKGIVGFKIKVQEVQAAYNLSQNRKEKDYSNIVDKLQAKKILILSKWQR